MYKIDKKSKFNFLNFLTFIGCLFIFYFLASLFSLYFFGNIFSEIDNAKNIYDLKKINFNDIFKIKMIISLSIRSVFVFILGPLIYFYLEFDNYKYNFFKKIQKKILIIYYSYIKMYLKLFNSKEHIPIIRNSSIGSSIVLIILILVLTSIINLYLNNLNKNMILPNCISDFQVRAAFLDFKLNYIFKKLLNTKSFLYLLLIIFSFAILPAIGEELTFRVLFQKFFFNLFDNIHLSILLTSIFFAFCHFQIYFILSRIFLSIILGYIYYWSQNIFFPIIVHFINNTIFFLIVFCKNIGIINFDIFKNYSISSYTLIPSILFLFILMHFLHKKILVHNSAILIVDEMYLKPFDFKE